MMISTMVGIFLTVCGLVFAYDSYQSYRRNEIIDSIDKHCKEIGEICDRISK